MWHRRTNDSSLAGGFAAVPLVIAHRGASAVAPENTLAAFAAARDAGADGVEFDVHVCASGQAVVFHDDDLERMAGRPERIDEMPLYALRRIELPDGQRIPTLDAVLAALPSPMLLNIELKTTRGTRRGRLVGAVLESIRRAGAGPRVLISSFDPRLLLRVRIAWPALPTGIVFRSRQRWPMRAGWPGRLLAPAAIHPEWRLVTAARVRRWASGGRLVNTWAIDDPDVLRRMATLGVDAVLTNDPAAARAALDASTASPFSGRGPRSTPVPRRAGRRHPR